MHVLRNLLSAECSILLFVGFSQRFNSAFSEISCPVYEQNLVDCCYKTKSYMTPSCA